MQKSFPLSASEPPCCLYDREQARATQRTTSRGSVWDSVIGQLRSKLTKHRVNQSRKSYYLDANAETKMEVKKDLEERLRELCCIGDERNLKMLVERGVNINSANAMNGWTPLHWAAKRGHASIVKYLVQQGVDTAALTSKGETAAQLSTDTGIRQLLGEGESTDLKTSDALPIVPNYLRNPDFFYAEKDECRMLERREQGTTSNTWNQEFSTDVASLENSNSCTAQLGEEIVVKLRIADSEEKDFIEVDLDKSNLTFPILEAVCCKELDIEANDIKKIRKLPNTIVRNDKDVKRLVPFQELEVVLKGNVS